MAKSDVEWVKNRIPKVQVSVFGEAVADLLGDLFKGIYHVENSLFRKRTIWSSSTCIDLVLGQELATYDGGLLTTLVFLAHDRSIRVSVEGASSGYLRLRFSPRMRYGDSIWKRHPSLEEAVKKFGDGSLPIEKRTTTA